jgi:hypothetical protein
MTQRSSFRDCILFLVHVVPAKMYVNDSKANFSIQLVKFLDPILTAPKRVQSLQKCTVMLQQDIHRLEHCGVRYFLVWCDKKWPKNVSSHFQIGWFTLSKFE